MASPIKVIAAKFEDLVAVGLQQLISEDPNLELIRDGIQIGAVEAAIEELSPQVVLLNFGTLRTPAQVFQLHQAHPEARLVVLANRPTAAECNQMLSFGATACISKETQGRDIINAIHLASRGMHVLPRSAAATAGQDEEEQQFGLPAPDLLTPREADVLELLQEGLSNKQIAQELSIGIETVRTHTRNIYAKLGVSTRRDLARFTRSGRRAGEPAAREPVGLR
jgi:DNA-binding NarL/FixJ family response regulator